jgi:hypothetical protein
MAVPETPNRVLVAPAGLELSLDDAKVRREMRVVASKLARGAACRRAEWIEGELVGGVIEAGERWHLGYPDGESVGGPEHVRCNTSAPSRLRRRVKRGR